jgi:hypothetical protein
VLICANLWIKTLCESSVSLCLCGSNRGLICGNLRQSADNSPAFLCVSVPLANSRGKSAGEIREGIADLGCAKRDMPQIWAVLQGRPLREFGLREARPVSGGSIMALPNVSRSYYQRLAGRISAWSAWKKVCLYGSEKLARIAHRPRCRGNVFLPSLHSRLRIKHDVYLIFYEATPHHDQ